MDKETFYITTPIYYVNDVPHIGHAYTTIAADVLSRYHRSKGDKVFFLTGTDEHGIKIQRASEEANKTPKEFVGSIAEKFKEAWASLNISYDNFIRTTDSAHEAAVKAVLQELYDKGHIYKGNYEALYCVGCEQFKMKSDLVDGKCPDHKVAPEVRSEECYLFRLSAFEERIKELIESETFKIMPLERRNEVLSFITTEGLSDISISRDKEKVHWGIDLPFDPSHTTYVWIDAFLNYLTGLGWPNNEANLNTFWPPSVQLMAKDILRVHATIWIAILLALELETPREYFIHGYFTVDGQKMSKSLGNVINPVALCEEYGADVIRYFILSEFPFGTDGDFSIKRLEEAFNSDLANDFGNLLHRSVSMMFKYYDGIIPAPSGADEGADHELKSLIEEVKGNLPGLYADLRFKEILAEIWLIIRRANKYIDEVAPWSLFKEKNEERLASVMYNTLEAIRISASLVAPFMPEVSARILGQLGADQQAVPSLSFGHLEPDTVVEKGEPLFPRIDLAAKA
ncbi:MAG: methionine--tRNA ligase [Actinomycetota bacterium]|nr:methionine--tRNA ligase [Actinomycetota bacterium]